MKPETLQKFGFYLVVAGLIGMLASAIIGFTALRDLDSGAMPACSFLCIMIGFAFCFPTLLEEEKGQLSTMRIIVFAVVMVFCTIYIKLAWSTATFQTLKIDQSWIYILGLAFGSKVFQKFGENAAEEKPETNTDNTPAQQPENVG